MHRHRLYIDESGDHTYMESPNPDTRYLGITGVLIEDDYYQTTVHLGLETLKQRHFPHNRDEPLILVRRLIIDKRGPFARLSDPTKLAAWNRDFLDYMAGLRATLFTVVIDKQMHHAQYGESAFHPYHYCMKVMLERLRGHLNAIGGTADVMAESRGRREDHELKQAYQSIWRHGTEHLPGARFQAVLTSKELKLKKKESNITGLQLADLVAAPSKQEIVAANGRPLTHPASTFTRQFNGLIRGKYNPYCRVLLGK